MALVCETHSYQAHDLRSSVTRKRTVACQFEIHYEFVTLWSKFVPIWHVYLGPRESNSANLLSLFQRYPLRYYVNVDFMDLIVFDRAL